MILNLNKSDLEEIDDIINHFVENNKEATTSLPALGFCLQKLIDGRKELEEYFEEEDD